MSEFVLSMALGSNYYTVVQTGIAAGLTGSTQVTGLQVGTTYRFKVQSRNLFGLSIQSEEIILTCAFTPLAP